MHNLCLITSNLTVQGGFFIKRVIAIAAILLIAGCSGKDSTNTQQLQQQQQQQQQQPQQQTKVQTQSNNNAASRSNLTQASSISTPNAGKSSVTAKQAPNDTSGLMDWFNRNYGSAKNPQNQTQNPPNQVQNPPNQAQNPKPSANPQQSADSSQFAQQVLNLVNQERTKAGLQSVSMNSSLSNMAMDKAQDMYKNNYFDHQSPTYGSPFDMMKAYGISFKTAGENIARGQQSPTEVMNQWMNSPGHRENIMDKSFTQIGVAYYNGEWVQEFIG